MLTVNPFLARLWEKLVLNPLRNVKGAMNSSACGAGYVFLPFFTYLFLLFPFLVLTPITKYSDTPASYVAPHSVRVVLRRSGRRVYQVSSRVLARAISVS